MSSRLSLSRSREDEGSSDSATTSTTTTTEEETTSSPIEAPSSVGPGRVPSSDGDDDIVPSESASRRASRAPIKHKGQLYADSAGAIALSRDSSHPRAPAPDPPTTRHHSRREHRDPGEQSEHRRHRRHHRHGHSSRHRPESVHSDSVESYYDETGRPRPAYAAQRYSQWGHVQQQPQPGYAASSVASAVPGYPYGGHGHPPSSQLVPYSPYDPHAAYYASAGHMPQHAPSPMSAIPPSGYFAEHHRPPPAPMPMMSPYPPYYPMPMHPGPYMSPPMSAAPSSPSEYDRIAKLEERLVSFEQARVAREEEERKARAEAERRAVESKAAKEALEEATKKAKESAEATAAKEKKEAQEDYDKKLAAAKKATEEAEAAAKKHKEAEEKAKKEADAAKPSPDDLKGPITFKDAVGRKFVFPWKNCKTWKGTEELIRQAFVHVDVLGEHVRQGHYDLMGPNGEIILPHVWESTVQPEWSITMHMWPMEEKKKEEPKVVGAAGAAAGGGAAQDRSVFGRKKSKRKKDSGMVIVPPPPPDVVAAGPPPPPPEGVAVVSDSDVAVPSSAAAMNASKEKKKNKGQPLLMRWTNQSMGGRTKK